jgi:amino acid permease
MLAETISLGVLSLPQAVATLGLVPGLLLIFFLGVIAYWTGIIIGMFKKEFPQVQTFADAGQLIAGPIGREVMAVSQVLILVFIMAAHVLSFSIAMNVLTGHAMCSVWFGLIGMLLSFALGLPRTMKAISFLSVFSCISVIVAVSVAMIAIGVSKPDMGNIVAVRPDVPLVKGLGPVMNIILAYAGHVAFFSFCAELKNPNDFPKALACMQITACTFYMLISAVIYCYAGRDVTSPALGSASTLVAKITFGIAMPTIVIAGVVNGTVACKYIYLRKWKGTDVHHEKSFKAVGSWVLICAISWIASWIIAEAIPSFNLLLSLIVSTPLLLPLLEVDFRDRAPCSAPGSAVSTIPPPYWFFADSDRWSSRCSLDLHEQGQAVLDQEEGRPHHPKRGHLHNGRGYSTSLLNLPCPF